MPSRGEGVDQGVVPAVRQVVVVLHAGDRDGGARLRDLRGRDVAQADVADQPLALQPREHGERLGEGALGGAVHAEHQAEVHHLQPLQAEVAEVVVHRGGQGLAGEGGVPRAVRAAHGADLGDDRERRAVGREGLADQPVGDVGAVEVAGVDVVHAARHRLAQHGERGGGVARGAEHAGPRELHGAVSEAAHGALAQGEGSGVVGHGGLRSCCDAGGGRWPGVR